jgi:sporulation protein YunB
VTALQTDLGTLNLIRANVVRQVKAELGDLEPITLQVPLGELFHTTLFASRGFRIPLEVTAADVVTAEFASRFSSEGINQTRHQIILRVTAQLEVLLPGGIQSLSAQTDVLVADTVLVGDVPESFAEFQGTDTAEDAMEDYYNFF